MDLPHADAPARRLPYTSALIGVFVVLCSIGAGRCDVDQPGGGIENQTCLACHDGRTATNMSHFPDSPHKSLSCETCHGNGYAHVRNGGRGGLILNPGKQPFDEQANFCGKCHESIVDGFFDTAHGMLEAVSCNDCHNVHEPLGLAVSSSLPNSLDTPGYAALCGDCHVQQNQEFLESGHAQSDVATCGSCHNVHTGGMLTASAIDNTLCLQCHGSFQLGFNTEAAIDFHTGGFHPVDPAGSGASRCTGCHLPPTQLDGQPDVPHDHTLFTVPPSATNDAIAAGDPVPPNTCSGVMGCHDPAVPGSGVPHDPFDTDQNTALQTLYDSIGALP